MTDTFRDLIEADFSSLMARAGEATADKITDKGKEIGNRFLTALGSSRGAGRLDLGLVVTDLRSQYKYYLQTQRAQPTVESWLDFVQTVFGMEIPEGELYKALYGYDPLKSPKPPQIMAPHKAVLDGYFKVIFNKRAAQPKLLDAAQNLVRYAENNDNDEDYIVLILKWLGARAPQMLSRPGLEPLKQFSHGGRIGKQQLEEILKGFASILIKQQIILQRMKQAQGDEAPAGAEGGEAGAADSDKQGSTKSEAGIKIDPPSTMQEGDWGGLKQPQVAGRPPSAEIVLKRVNLLAKLNAQSFEAYAPRAKDDAYWTQFHAVIDNVQYQKLNATSAQLMYRIQRYPMQDFVNEIKRYQQDMGMMIWPQENTVKAWRFARANGPYDEITAELNHFANNPTKAALLMVGLMRFIAVEEEKLAGAGQPPADQDGGDAA